MLKFDNTPAVWPRFPVVMPSFTTQPVLFYSMLPNQQNCCHLPHILPIAFRLAGKMLPKSNTILPLPWFKRACATQTGTVTAAALRTSSVSLMWPFDTHHFVPDVQGVVFLYSFCATRFQTILFRTPQSIVTQVPSEMRRYYVPSRLITCTDIMPPFCVGIV